MDMGEKEIEVAIGVSLVVFTFVMWRYHVWKEKNDN